MAPLLWQLAGRHPQRQVRWLQRRAPLPLQTLIQESCPDSQGWPREEYPGAASVLLHTLGSIYRAHRRESRKQLGVPKVVSLAREVKAPQWKGITALKARHSSTAIIGAAVLSFSAP